MQGTAGHGLRELVSTPLVTEQVPHLVGPQLAGGGDGLPHIIRLIAQEVRHRLRRRRRRQPQALENHWRHTSDIMHRLQAHWHGRVSSAMACLAMSWRQAKGCIDRASAVMRWCWHTAKTHRLSVQGLEEGDLLGAARQHGVQRCMIRRRVDRLLQPVLILP